MGIQSLLVATDLTERSDRAVDRAVRLAAEHKATLHIVHVVDEGLPADLADSQKQAARASIRKSLDSLPAAKSVEILLKVESGRDWETLLDIAAAVSADCMVLGLHRRRGIRDLFRGTTVERILRNGRIPVLIVSGEPGDTYRQGVAGVDFSDSSRRALEFAARLAPGAGITLVHTYDVPFKGFLGGQSTPAGLDRKHEAQVEEKIHHEINEFVASLECDGSFPNRILREGNVYERLREEVAASGADLLVLGTEGRSGVVRMMIGSVAENLIADPPCDVLAVRAA